MQRICSIILCILFILPLLIACENSNGGTDDTKKSMVSIPRAPALIRLR